LVHKRLGLGTPGPDVIHAGAQGARLVFSGLGSDRFRADARDAVGNGGLGADRIVVGARNDVANGGPGGDRLIAKTGKRALLFGGPGHDTLVGGAGATLINAKDGERDVVKCGSGRNRVLVDRRDVARGPCRPFLHH
jgi:Ca2+-binding RTX toxin-like protein